MANNTSVVTLNQALGDFRSNLQDFVPVAIGFQLLLAALLIFLAWMLHKKKFDGGARTAAIVIAFIASFFAASTMSLLIWLATAAYVYVSNKNKIDWTRVAVIAGAACGVLGLLLTAIIFLSMMAVTQLVSA